MEAFFGLLGSVVGIALGGWFILRLRQRALDREFEDYRRGKAAEFAEWQKEFLATRAEWRKASGATDTPPQRGE